MTLAHKWRNKKRNQYKLTLAHNNRWAQKVKSMLAKYKSGTSNKIPAHYWLTDPTWALKNPSRHHRHPPLPVPAYALSPLANFWILAVPHVLAAGNTAQALHRTNTMLRTAHMAGVHTSTCLTRAADLAARHKRQTPTWKEPHQTLYQQQVA